jgi:hypothetical protein
VCRVDLQSLSAALSPKRDFKTAEGVAIGKWISNQRETLQPYLDKDGNDITNPVIKERIHMLNEIEFPWQGKCKRRSRGGATIRERK